MKAIVALALFVVLSAVPAAYGSPKGPSENSPAYGIATTANLFASMDQPVEGAKLFTDKDIFIYFPEEMQNAPGNSEVPRFIKLLEDTADDYGVEGFDIRGVSPIALIYNFPRKQANGILPDLPPNNPHLEGLVLPPAE
jgi:hypothetical protein